VKEARCSHRHQCVMRQGDCVLPLLQVFVLLLRAQRWAASLHLGTFLIKKKTKPVVRFASERP
jgi:hypothetical protein